MKALRHRQQVMRYQSVRATVAGSVAHGPSPRGGFLAAVASSRSSAASRRVRGPAAGGAAVARLLGSGVRFWAMSPCSRPRARAAAAKSPECERMCSNYAPPATAEPPAEAASTA